MNDEIEIIKHPIITYMKAFLVNLEYRNPHLHNDFELCLIIDGNVNICIANEKLALTQGSMILLNQNQPHELNSVNKNSLILSVQISHKFCDDYFPSLNKMEFDATNITNLLNAEQQLMFRSLLTEVALRYFKKNFGFEFACIGLLNILFYQLLNCVPYHIISDAEQSVSLKRVKRLKRIIDYIEDHYTEKLLLSDIAQNEKLSLTYMSHLFKSNFNMTFQQYLNSLRLEKAKRLIVKSDMKLLDICMECGFSDGKYLNKLFCRQYGCRPKEYRKNNRNIRDPEFVPSSLITMQKIYPESESLTILKKYFTVGNDYLTELTVRKAITVFARVDQSSPAEPLSEPD